MLLTVIMMMVLLGAIGAALTATLGDQHAQVSLRQLERQALYAAQGGANWGRQRARDGACAGNTSLAIADTPVTVRCTVFTVSEDVDTYTIFHLVAEAQSGTYGDPTFVRRTVRERVIVR